MVSVIPPLSAPSLLLVEKATSQACSWRDSGCKLLKLREPIRDCQPAVATQQMTAEQHGAAAILLAEIVQVTKALHLPKEVIVEILQQEPHQGDIVDTGQQVALIVSAHPKRLRWSLVWIVAALRITRRREAPARYQKCKAGSSHHAPRATAHSLRSPAFPY